MAKVIVVKVPEIEKEAEKRAEKIDAYMGVHVAPRKEKGGVARSRVNKGMTKGVKSGRMKTIKMDADSKLFQDYIARLKKKVAERA